MATEGVQLIFEQEALKKIGAFGCIREGPRVKRRSHHSGVMHRVARQLLTGEHWVLWSQPLSLQK